MVYMKAPFAHLDPMQRLFALTATRSDQDGEELRKFGGLLARAIGSGSNPSPKTNPEVARGCGLEALGGLSDLPPSARPGVHDESKAKVQVISPQSRQPWRTAWCCVVGSHVHTALFRAVSSARISRVSCNVYTALRRNPA